MFSAGKKYAFVKIVVEVRFVLIVHLSFYLEIHHMTVSL